MLKMLKSKSNFYLVDSCLIGFFDPLCLRFCILGAPLRWWWRASNSGTSKSKSPRETSKLSARFDGDTPEKKWSIPSSWTVTLPAESWRCDDVDATATSSPSSNELLGGGGLPQKRRGFGVILILSMTSRSSLLLLTVDGVALGRFDFNGVTADGVTIMEFGLRKSDLATFCILAATVNFSASFSPTFACQLLWADWSWNEQK